MAQNRRIVFNQMYEATGGAQGWQAEADWGTFPVAVMLLRNDGPGLGKEWFDNNSDALRDVATVAAAASAGMVELTPNLPGVGTGYARQEIPLAGRTITTQQSPTDLGRWNISVGETIFGTAVDPGETIQAVMVYTGPAAELLNPVFDGQHDLLFMQEYATTQQTQASQVSVTWPNSFLFQLTQGPDI